jgi:hypothetical protein
MLSWTKVNFASRHGSKRKPATDCVRFAALSFEACEPRAVRHRGRLTKISARPLTRLGSGICELAAVQLNGLKRFDFFGQSLSRDVQPSLDRSDRSCEGIAHFDQALAVDIKGFQRSTIERTQSFQSVANVSHTFIGQDASQRIVVVDARRVERFLFDGDRLASPRQSVDGQAMCDHSNPTTECIGRLKLRQPAEGLNENVLAQLQRLVPVSQPLVSDELNLSLVPSEELAHGSSVTVYGTRYQFRQSIFLFIDSFDSRVHVWFLSRARQPKAYGSTVELMCRRNTATSIRKGDAEESVGCRTDRGESVKNFDPWIEVSSLERLSNTDQAIPTAGDQSR